MSSELFAHWEGGQDWYRHLPATTQAFPVPVALIPHLVSMGARAGPSPWVSPPSRGKGAWRSADASISSALWALSGKATADLVPVYLLHGCV